MIIILLHNSYTLFANCQSHNLKVTTITRSIEMSKVSGIDIMSVMCVDLVLVCVSGICGTLHTCMSVNVLKTIKYTIHYIC